MGLVGHLDMARDIEVRAAIGDLAAGRVGAGLAGGDAAALRDRLPGVDIHMVEDAPLLAVSNPRLAGDVHLSFSLSSCSPNPRTPNKNQCNVFLAKSRPSRSRLYKFLVS